MKRTYRKRPSGTLTRIERNGIWLLISACLALVLFSSNSVEKPIDPTKLVEIIPADSSREVEDFHQNEFESQDFVERPTSKTQQSVTLKADAPFNPTTLSEDGWMKIGLSKTEAKQVVNCFSKGFILRQATDLQKIYALKNKDLSAVIPFVELYENPKQCSAFVKTEKQLTAVNLNTADTSELQRLPGIGKGFATRISKYRNRLGGFYSVNQLYEVYGIDSEVVTRILPRISTNESDLQKLHINTINKEILGSHPYCTNKEATILLNYRFVHGPFKTKEDLLNVKGIDEQRLKKLIPYLDFGL